MNTYNLNEPIDYLKLILEQTNISQNEDFWMMVNHLFCNKKENISDNLKMYIEDFITNQNQDCNEDRKKFLVEYYLKNQPLQTKTSNEKEEEKEKEKDPFEGVFLNYT